MAGNNSQPGRSVLSKASEILSLFEVHQRPLPLSFITEETGMPSSSVHRLLQELCALGLLNRTPDNRYQPGLRLWRIGESVGFQLRSAAFPFVQDLYTAAGQTTHLAVRDGTEALYLMRLYGTKRIPRASATGGRLPLHTTAVGKAILAHESPETRDSVLDTANLSTGFSGPNARIDRESIVAELHKVRELGFATTFEEQRVGTASIAVPIFHTDTVGGALGIVVRADQRATLKKYLPALVKTSQRIQKATAHTPLESLVSKSSTYVEQFDF